MELTELLSQKNVSSREKAVNDALIKLAMDGTVKAFLCPDGEIRFQYNIAHEWGIEGPIKKLDAD